MTYTLGISAYYHDSAAALLQNGALIAAAQEERFTRIKHDASFPVNAIQYVLNHANIQLDQVENIVFYEKPFIKWERLLETYIEYSPQGLKSFLQSMPVWLKEKLFLKQELKKQLLQIGNFDFSKKPIQFSEHHLSHACSSYYSSGFQESAILTIDGVGEWASTAIFKANGNEIKKIAQINFPHSVGLFYSAITSFLGFRVNSGEYKVMGLAPYGNLNRAEELAKIMRDKLITVFENGSVFLNLDVFHFVGSERMYRKDRIEKILGISERSEEEKVEHIHADIALALQMITEDVLERMCSYALSITQSNHICLAGGVALNAVANGKLKQLIPNSVFYFYPNAGDAGAAAGAAYASYFIGSTNVPEKYQQIYTGPAYTDAEIEALLKEKGATYIYHESFIELCKEVVSNLKQGKFCGWFRGRMEWGPRALGNRSILADPRRSDVQVKLNLAVKFRESFRPFAPAIIEEKVGEYFNDSGADPFMISVRKFKESFCLSKSPEIKELSLDEKRDLIKSDFPAVTHVDFSARVQTVSKDVNPDFYTLLSMFEQETACPMLVNTSFNVRGEPIVCSPNDAWNCFMNSGIDVLVIGNFVLYKEDQKNSIFTKLQFKPD